MSLQRKHLGDLRSSPLDGIGPEWLQNYTIGDPDVHIDDIVIVDHLAHYVEPLVAEQHSFNAQKNILSALNSNFRGRLQVGDLLEFRSPDFPDEHQHATVKELIDNNNVLLAAGSGIQIRGAESIRLMRLFTGTAYRFHVTSRHQPELDATFKSIKAPTGHYYDHHGHLHEGAPPVAHDDHGGGHGGGGHGGGHGEGTSFDPGVRPGKYKVFYKSFPLGKYYRHVKYECQYVKGLKSGAENHYLENGAQPLIKNWLNGKLHGRYQVLYDSGTNKLICNYQNGILHGNYIEFHPNGNRALKTTYVDGKLDGVYQTWTADNYDVIKRKFTMGEPVEKIPSTGGGGGGH